MTTAVKYLDSLAIDASARRALKQLSFSATGTRRICLHGSPDAPLHVMLVECAAGVIYPPHSHTDSDEVSIAVEGILEITKWGQERAAPPAIIHLGDGEVLSIFMPRGVPHQTRAVGGNCVFLEIKLGPFRPDAIKMYAELADI